MSLHVVTWSGGPDSTYTLMKVLQETDEPVLALSCFFGNDRFQQASIRAVRQLEAAMLQRFRPFDVRQFALRSLRGVKESVVHEELNFLCVGSCMSMKSKDPILYWSRCADDDGPNSYFAFQQHRIDRYSNAVRELIPHRVVGQDVTKIEIRDALGDLWPLTWSCAEPTKALKPCGICEKCIERQPAEEQ